MKPDKLLFELVDKKSREKWKQFAKYYANDSKPFINKISRDYAKRGKFPLHVLKTIKSIKKEDYHSAVCILRGGLPYSVLFEACGWKVHYVICGRINEKFGTLRFNKGADSTLNKIKGQKILLIENNSPSGRTPSLVAKNLEKSFKIKKPDLFLDYFIRPRKRPEWLELAFWENKKKLNNFGRVYVAEDVRVSEKERSKLIKEFLDMMRIRRKK